MDRNENEVILPWPDAIDADTPQETALAAVRHLERILELTRGYMEQTEKQLVNGAMQDEIDNPDHRLPPANPYLAAQLKLEYAKLHRAGGALGVALGLVTDVRELLETPLLQRPGVGD